MRRQWSPHSLRATTCSSRVHPYKPSLHTMETSSSHSMDDDPWDRIRSLGSWRRYDVSRRSVLIHSPVHTVHPSHKPSSNHPQPRITANTLYPSDAKSPASSNPKNSPPIPSFASENISFHDKPSVLRSLSLVWPSTAVALSQKI